MSYATLAQPEVATTVPHRNGNSFETAVDKIDYTSFSTLRQLPGVSTNLGIEAVGEELGQLFTRHPDLPGVILFDGSQFAGVISQAHYYKCISRAFGREIYYRRPAGIMLADIAIQPLILLSSCEIPSAVGQCLSRPADFVYEPFLVRDVDSGEYRLCSFQNLLLAATQLAELRNRQMEQILNSVTDGLLVIDRNFRIGGEYSSIVDKLFERSDLRNATLPEVLQPLVDNVTYEQVHDYLNILFDPKLIDRLIKSINPAKQISVSFPSTGPQPEKRVKHFAINFERIRIQSEISQVLVRIEDITQQMNLARELEQQGAAAQEKLQLVMQILQAEPDAVNRFASRFDDMLSGLRDAAGAGLLDAEGIHVLFRQVHTLKGEAALLHFAGHERALHQFEDRLEKMRSQPDDTTAHAAILNAASESLQAQGERIHEALDQLKSLGSGTRLHVQPSGMTMVAPTPAASFAETLSRLITDLGRRLGKSAEFHSVVGDHEFPAQHRDVLHDILVHLARNSMVHGIETTEERVAAGKGPQGLIQLHLKAHPEFDEVIFQDDGRGLDYDKIRRRAVQLGWNLASEEQLRMAIFEHGFSTADKVTDLAGRGVGLDAIRDSLQKIGGRILPYSEPGSYCAFQILLPKVPAPVAA